MKFNFDFKSTSASSFKFPMLLRLLLLCTAALTLVCAWWPSVLYLSHMAAEAVQRGGGLMYLLEAGAMAVAVLVTASVSGILLFGAFAKQTKPVVKSSQRARSSLELAERLTFMDEESRKAELEKLQCADAAAHRVVVSMLQQWRAEAKQQAEQASAEGLKMSVPRWCLLAEEQAALIKELRSGSNPVKATATDATWLVLPDQLEMLKKLGALMRTDDYNVILRDALLLLFVAHKPGTRPIRLDFGHKESHACEKAMACLDALMVMPEVEKLSNSELRDVVRWWKYCADLACTHRVPGVVAPPDSLEWVDTALVLPLTPADPDITTAAASEEAKALATACEELAYNVILRDALLQLQTQLEQDRA